MTRALHQPDIPATGGGRCAGRPAGASRRTVNAAGRGQRRGIVLVELDQGLDQVAGRGVLGGVGVGLEFMAAREQAHQRGEREGEYRHDQEEQDQRQRGVLRIDAGPA